MKPELDAALVTDFPTLYAQRFDDMQSTCMCWGFECDDGWEPIIRKLSEKLEFLNNIGVVKVEAIQVKEKFGTMRFYTSIMDSSAPLWADIVWALTDEAEGRTAWTCERCGKDGKLRGTGWVRTLCDNCEAERIGAGK
jgi:hypothetical protein